MVGTKSAALIGLVLLWSSDVQSMPIRVSVRVVNREQQLISPVLVQIMNRCLSPNLQIVATTSTTKGRHDLVAEIEEGCLQITNPGYAVKAIQLSKDMIQDVVLTRRSHYSFDIAAEMSAHLGDGDRDALVRDVLAAYGDGKALLPNERAFELSRLVRLSSEVRVFCTKQSGTQETARQCSALQGDWEKLDADGSKQSKKERPSTK